MSAPFYKRKHDICIIAQNRPRENRFYSIVLRLHDRNYIIMNNEKSRKGVIHEIHTADDNYSLSHLCGRNPEYFIPLPIPASIYGLVLMFLLLVTGIVKLPQVKETAEFLVEIMTIMFIPATVGLMENWDVLRPILVPLIVIIPVTTVLVMGITGRTAQHILRRGGKENE